MPSRLAFKDDFFDHVRWSLNIPEESFGPHIEDAQYYDLRPLAGDQIVDVLLSLGLHDSDKPELRSFWKTFVKPVVVLFCSERFLVWQGRNVTNFGLVTMKEESSEPISDKARAELIADVQKKLAIRRTKLLNELSSKKGVFDGTTYTLPDSEDVPKSRSFGISAVKKKCTDGSDDMVS